MTPRYAVYARYSTDRQSETSLDDQVRRCSEYVKRHGGVLAAVYKDEAISGAKFKSRPDLQRMLADAEKGRTRPFDFVVVDDLSRLSREMLPTLSVIFDRLKRVNVVFVDQQTGQSSNNPQSLVFFTAMAMAAQLQREASRSQTHRGLDGLFQKGRSTGGRCFGFETRDGVPAVKDDEAAIVRRVFDAYADGLGLKAIAEMLNADGIAAPYDGSRPKRQGLGWSHTTIRNMLSNERYAGRWVWNKRAFDRRSLGAAESRLPRERAEHEVRVDERPHLRVVSEAAWAAVQQRLESTRARRGGREPGASRTPYLAGGLLICGCCGAHFGIVGQRTKNGRKYRTLGCSAHQTRGATICANSRTVSERRVSEHLTGSLQALLGDEAFLRTTKEAFQRTIAAELAGRERCEGSLVAEKLRLEKARANLLKLIESCDAPDDALLARYAELGRKVRELERAVVEAPNLVPLAVPDLSVVDEYVKDLRAVLEQDIGAANEALKAALPHKLRMVPKDEGPDHFYEVTGALEFGGPLRGYSEGQSCGGLRSPLSNNAPERATRIPFAVPFAPRRRAA